MKSRVYTLTGDKGTTSLVGGRRVDKDDVRVEAYGTIDELNAAVGMLCHALEQEKQSVDFLRKVQNKLFNIGAYLATDSIANDDKLPVDGLADDDVKAIESHIDAIDARLPALHAFILPGGSRLACLCDVCRTVTRRAERRIVSLSKVATVNPLVLHYVNRLSDFFFVFARFNNVANENTEIYWDKNA